MLLRIFTLFFVLFVSACSGSQKKKTEFRGLASSTPLSMGVSSLESASKGEGPFALVNILNPDVLSRIESLGYSINETLLGSGASENLKDLVTENSYYASIVNTVGQPLPHTSNEDQMPLEIPVDSGDVPEMVKVLRNTLDSGGPFRPAYKITQVSNDSHHPYKVVKDGDEPRHFDYRWLSSEFAHLPLIAIVNRMDKKDLYPSSCGEIRFIYRLSYHVNQTSSSMPFFLNVVYTYPKANDRCQSYASKWMVKKGIGGDSEGFDQILGTLKELEFKQVELNFQAVRFTSGYMHDFGGQAMYIQRIFKFNRSTESAFPILLENSPHVGRVSQNRQLKVKLANYIKNNLQAIDQGIANINFGNSDDNEAILSKRSISWSTLGRARSINKPFRTIFKSPEDRELLPTDSELAGLKFIKNRNGLMERLDNRTCVGCHQSAGTAGFHMLGYPQQNFSHHFNRQQLPLSAHAFAEVTRRTAYVKALAEGKTPNTFRPHSIFSPAKGWNSRELPKFNAHKARDLCMLNEKAAFAVSPSCGSIFGKSTSCVRTVSVSDSDITTLLGECVEENTTLAGSVCYNASINEADLFDVNSDFYAFKDNLKNLQKIQNCGSPKGGAPLGRRSKKCTADQEKFSDIEVPLKSAPRELCANRGGNGFDVCAASGDAGQCLENRVARSMLDTCSPDNFCREDYICQAFPDYQNISDKHYRKLRRGNRVNLADLTAGDKSHINGVVNNLRREAQMGFCVPTYFLFNMRTDGHPNPESGTADGFPKIDPSLPMRGI